VEHRSSDLESVFSLPVQTHTDWMRKNASGATVAKFTLGDRTLVFVVATIEATTIDNLNAAPAGERDRTA
jgi:hypothetical protein